MTNLDLAVVLNGRLAGTITHDFGRPHFTYADDYARAAGRLTPLSLSMPLRPGHTYRHQQTAPWLSGLLPEDNRVLEGWAAQYGVSARNTSALLRHLGRDCAGAVQLAPASDVDDVLAQTGHTEPITETDLGTRLRLLIDNPGRWTAEGERWSLPGMQGKFTAVRTSSGWATAHGNAASTHIIKPGITQFKAQALNEHLCQKVLPTIGIAAAHTEYHEFDGVPAIVVARYDRVEHNGKILRLHQEDMCQALSMWPNKKYASDGGPSAITIAKLLAERATQNDVDRFADIVVAQYLLGAPDGHAKNYSVILVSNRVTLAPIYDVASVLPYNPDPSSNLSRVAMPIAGRSRFGTVDLHTIAKFATKAGTDPDRLVERTRDMTAALPDAIAAAAADVPTAILGPLATNLQAGVAQQCATVDRPPRTAPPGPLAPVEDSDDDQPSPEDPAEDTGDGVPVVSYTRGKHQVRTHIRRRPAKHLSDAT
ncbi:type II toxin-antitoxin system HipA family toxin [Mycobacterium simiae]|uniref:Type II toxin-antitoxin system HipA family toxin n=1 Tax=Mycobacterium simiae TaxID=1784 RepID=A0A5B1BSH2_MYCSI|nr:HipA domain-containing protein [Mycobacterium simiae]KAA1250204.1 type II toxin-antitoxin system HipA family toxin [Mycobacterium simiae]